MFYKALFKNDLWTTTDRNKSINYLFIHSLEHFFPESSTFLDHLIQKFCEVEGGGGKYNYVKILLNICWVTKLWPQADVQA